MACCQGDIHVTPGPQPSQRCATMYGNDHEKLYHMLLKLGAFPTLNPPTTFTWH
jgi:hypothetical protein